MEVFFSNKAGYRLKRLTEHLLQEWGYKVKKDFLDKLNGKISLISDYPESCPKTGEYVGLHKCVVTKQTTFYYRILFDSEEIEVVVLSDTRQDLDNLKKEMD